jgi:hypothetical protein
MMKEHTRELLTSDIVSRIFSFKSGMQGFLHQERIEQHLENVASLPEGN